MSGPLREGQQTPAVAQPATEVSTGAPTGHTRRGVLGRLISLGLGLGLGPGLAGCKDDAAKPELATREDVQAQLNKSGLSILNLVTSIYAKYNKEATEMDLSTNNVNLDQINASDYPILYGDVLFINARSNRSPKPDVQTPSSNKPTDYLAIAYVSRTITASDGTLQTYDFLVTYDPEKSKGDNLHVHEVSISSRDNYPKGTGKQPGTIFLRMRTLSVSTGEDVDGSTVKPGYTSSQMANRKAVADDTFYKPLSETSRNDLTRFDSEVTESLVLITKPQSPQAG